MEGLVVLLGHRIGYSASPAMHNAAFAALGLPLSYELRDVAPDALPAAVAELRGRDRAGANVTKPHKMAVIDLVDELAPEVRRVGAANTIATHAGRLVAHNTDLAALAAEVRELCEQAQARGNPVARAVVLGTGGASRAAQAALADAGIEPVVIGRPQWAGLDAALRDAQLLINATPLGTGGDEVPVPGELLRTDLAVLDLVYRPSPTALVRAARAAGAVARDGAGMLLRQAAASLTVWTGCQPPLDEMRAALAAELRREARGEIDARA